jgi:hypothetical protein
MEDADRAYPRSTNEAMYCRRIGWRFFSVLPVVPRSSPHKVRRIRGHSRNPVPLAYTCVARCTAPAAPDSAATDKSGDGPDVTRLVGFALLLGGPFGWLYERVVMRRVTGLRV